MSEDSDKINLSERLALLTQKFPEMAANCEEPAPKEDAPAEAAESGESADPSNEDSESTAKSNDFSIWVGNVDISVKKEKLEEFFNCCGTIKRITIPFDRYTRKPKTYAYIEFENKESVENALKFDSHLLGGRNIKVTPKKDVPHVTTFTPRRRRTFRRKH